MIPAIHILVEGRKILNVSKEVPEIPAIEYDLSGYTVMPGFINTHVHLIDCFDPFNEDKLKKWLMSGITALRDEGILSRHTAKDAVNWRDKCKNSSTYPSIAICGKFIAENYIADIIAVKGNPYDIPYLLSSVNFVMKDGVIVKPR